MNITALGDSCVSCGICAKLCPKQCITIKRNADGFFQPHIQQEQCIDCGICFNRCSLHSFPAPTFERQAFFGTAHDLATVKASTSGGFFATFAKLVIEDGGVVFGAAYFPEDKEVRHTSTRHVPLEQLLKSKYVESNLADSYQEVQAELNRHTPVLFCGTPCQVNGLKQWIRDPNGLLLTCDFICHGVPSSQLLKEHLLWYEKKNNTRLTHIDFRPKEEKWAEPSRLKFFSEKHPHGKAVPWIFDTYYRGFYENITLRKSCYHCSFSTEHSSDIILADFWGYIHFDKSLNTKDGLSLLIANSPKGLALLERAKDFADIQPLDFKYAEYAFRPDNISRCIVKRDCFFEQYRKHGFEKAAKKTYCKGLHWKRFVSRIKTQLINSYRKVRKP